MSFHRNIPGWQEPLCDRRHRPDSCLRSREPDICERRCHPRRCTGFVHGGCGIGSGCGVAGLVVDRVVYRRTFGIVDDGYKTFVVGDSGRLNLVGGPGRQLNSWEALISNLLSQKTKAQMLRPIIQAVRTGTWSGICAHVVPAMYMVAILSGPTMAGMPWSSSMPAAIDACRWG